MKKIIFPALLLLLAACTTSHVDHSLTLTQSVKVAMLPIVNNSQTPLAGERAENILTSLWYQKKLPELSVYPRKVQSGIPVLDDSYRLQQAQQWLKSQHVDYVLTGSIEEWRYKAGLDGEPAVAATLYLYQAGQKVPVWTGTIARTGWGRESLAATAQIVLEALLENIEVSDSELKLSETENKEAAK